MSDRKRMLNMNLRERSEMKNNIIIGGGPAGLGAAYQLQDNCLLLEKEDRPGGLMKSKTVNDFVFDMAGHIFFTADDAIRKLVVDVMGSNFHWQDRSAWIYSNNVYTRYPFQANTYGLPAEVVKECIMGLIEARYKNTEKMDVAHFEDWIKTAFGSGIAKHFMLPYNRKLWKIPLNEMSCEWFALRVPEVSIEDVLDGALQVSEVNPGPNSKFGYPLYGGCEAIIRALLKRMPENMRTNAAVTRVIPEKRAVEINGSEEMKYANLIATMPLPELVNIIESVPEEIAEAASGLRHVSIVCVNIGVKNPDFTDKNWIYYPENNTVFQRNFIQGNASEFACPEGCSSLTAEISYHKHERLADHEYINKTREGLKAVGLIASEEEIIVTDIVDIPYAYVIYDDSRAARVSKIRKYLEKKGILLAGRYAEWEYYNMDHSLTAGMRAAKRVAANTYLVAGRRSAVTSTSSKGATQ